MVPGLRLESGKKEMKRSGQRPDYELTARWLKGFAFLVQANEDLVEHFKQKKARVRLAVTSTGRHVGNGMREAKGGPGDEHL